MTQKIEKIGIIGGGKMGTSLFNSLSGYDFKIVWYIRTNTESQKKKHSRKLNRALKNGLITSNEFEFKSQNQLITNSINDVSECQLIIECISENLLAKQTLIKELFSIIKQDAIIASNSSSFKPDTLSTSNDCKTRIVGLHFFYPVEIKHITEFVLSNYNSEEDIKKIEAFLKSIKKFYLIQNEQSAFLLNRIMLKLQAAAFNYVSRNNSSFEQIDASVKQHLFPMGIFEMMDHVGIDIIYQSAESYIEDEENKSIFLPLMNFMEKCIQENKLGIKTQHGFYDYSNTISSQETNNKNKKQITNYIADSYLSAYNWALTLTNSKALDITFCMDEYLDADTQKWNN